MVMKIVAILAFTAIGALIGFLANRFLFQTTSLVINILLGVAGSLGASWGMSLLGYGTGILSFSLWGILFGVLGACLLVAIYGLISRYLANRHQPYASRT